MRSIKKNLIYQILYRVLVVATPLITTPIITRALGVNQLGVYSATQAFVNYFMLAAMLGIEKYGQRTIAAAKTMEEKENLFWEIFSVQVLSSGTAILVYYICLSFYSGERFEVMLIQGIWLFSCLFNINWFFFGCEKFRIPVIRYCVFRSITVVCVALFVRSKDDLSLYCVILACGALITELVLWISLRKIIRFRRVRFKYIKTHIKEILILFIPVIAISIYHIMDKTMLDLLSTESETGFYYSADKIINIPLGLITAVGTVVLPRMSYLFNNETITEVKEMLGKSVELTLFMTCAVGFGIAAISHEFIPFFLGEGFEQCVRLMYIFVPILLIKSFSDIVRNQFLIPARMDRDYTIAVLGGVFPNIIMNALLIPRFGAMGAAIGTLAAEFVVLLLQMWRCRKQIRFFVLFVRHSAYTINGFLMFVAVRLLARYLGCFGVAKILFLIIFGAFVYLSCCFVLWRIRKQSIFHHYLEFTPFVKKNK